MTKVKVKGGRDERQCVGCGEYKNRVGMTRVVIDGGRAVIDATGRSGGRGAYVCNNSRCVEAAAKKKGLERSFKRAVDKGIYDEMRKYVGFDDREANSVVV